MQNSFEFVNAVLELARSRTEWSYNVSSRDTENAFCFKHYKMYN